MIEKDLQEKRKKIEAEVEDWKKNPPEEVPWHAHLNNFGNYLPSSKYKENGGCFAGHILFENGQMDDKIINTSLADDGNKHSELFLNQTPREFFDTIIKTIEDSGLSMEKILQLQDKRLACSSNTFNKKSILEKSSVLDSMTKNTDDLYEYILPLYINLRVMGYEYFDLHG